MADDRGALRLEERLAAKERLNADLLAPPGRGLAGIAVVLAALAYAGIRFPIAAEPEARRNEPVTTERPVALVLPPPPSAPQSVSAPAEAPAPQERIPSVRLATDPIQDPFVPLDASDAPPDVEMLAAEPEPVTAAPVAPGAAGEATAPVLIPESRVEPVYPEGARRRGIDATLVLRILVRADGSVGDVSVLRSSRRNLGFETSASRAVRAWRYRPALREGRPVDTYVYVQIRFKPGS